MLIGYARVSTEEQSLDAQMTALENAGCERIFHEKVSTRDGNRPELARLLAYVRDGEDTIVVTRLDRVARSVHDLIAFTRDLETRNLGLIATQQAVDTSTAMGRMFFHVLAAVAEFERDMIRERTLAGLAAARARGKKGGRPTKMTPTKIAAARKMYDEKTHSLDEIAGIIGVGRTTVWNHVHLEGRNRD